MRLNNKTCGVADRRVSASVRLSGDEVIVESINVNDDSVGVGGKGVQDLMELRRCGRQRFGAAARPRV